MVAPVPQLPLEKLGGPGMEGLSWILVLLFLLPTLEDLLATVQLPLLSEENWRIKES